MSLHDPAVERLGITFERSTTGDWLATLMVSENDLNGHGVCHGGVIFLLADAVFDRVTNSDLADGEVAYAANASVEFVRGGQPGDVLTATGSAQDRWGRSTLVDVLVTNQNGETVAHFRGKTRTVARST